MPKLSYVNEFLNGKIFLFKNISLILICLLFSGITVGQFSKKEYRYFAKWSRKIIFIVGVKDRFYSNLLDPAVIATSFEDTPVTRYLHLKTRDNNNSKNGNIATYLFTYKLVLDSTYNNFKKNQLEITPTLHYTIMPSSLGDRKLTFQKWRFFDEEGNLINRKKNKSWGFYIDKESSGTEDDFSFSYNISMLFGF